jgi:hypothetical protein
VYTCTYNGVVSPVQNLARVGALVRRVEGAGVSAATLKADWEDVPLTVVGRTIGDDLEGGVRTSDEFNY